MALKYFSDVNLDYGNCMKMDKKVSNWHYVVSSAPPLWLPYWIIGLLLNECKPKKTRQRSWNYQGYKYL